MSQNEEEKPLSLFLDDFPSRGTLTELVTGCILPADNDKVEGTMDSLDGNCSRIDCNMDPPMILELKKPRHKTKKERLERNKEIRKSQQLKRGIPQSPTTKRKKSKVHIDLTLSTICGSDVITNDPIQTQQKLTSKRKTELIEIASCLGLPTTGLKREIIARLMKQYHLDQRAGLTGARRSSSVNE